MFQRIIRLISIFAVVAVAVYFVILNTENSTLHLSPNRSVSASSGVLFLAIFALGAIVSALVSTLVGLKAYFREKSLQRKERKQKMLFDSMQRARNLGASGELISACNEWQSIIKLDPRNLIARVELANLLDQSGDSKQALHILDEARAIDSKNTDVLFAAANLNIKLNNKTAAIDNLVLILCHNPSIKVAKLARNLSEDLGRLEDAIEYQRKLDELDCRDTDCLEATLRLEFKRTLKNSLDKAAREEAIQNFLRKNTDYVPALREFARIQCERNNYEQAANALVKGARLSNSQDLWAEAIRVWLNAKSPERALAVARMGCKETNGQTHIALELHLIRLYLVLNMLDDAKKALDNLPQSIKESGAKMGRDQLQSILFLEGLCLNNMGKHRESGLIWGKLLDANLSLDTSRLDSIQVVDKDIPSPALSTP